MARGAERVTGNGDGVVPGGAARNGTAEAAADGIVLVRWPAEAAERQALAARGIPRLLLVEQEAPAPTCDDLLEDWVRLPASDADLAARAAGLERRASSVSDDGRPRIDADGVVRVGGSWAALPPVEARLMAALVDRLGAVVHRDDLAAAGWPDGLPGRNALDVHVLRLRRRIAPVGLVIRTIRARGYLLEVDASAGDG